MASMPHVALAMAICKALSSKASLGNPWVRLINERRSKMADPRVLQSMYEHINPGLTSNVPGAYSVAHPLYARGQCVQWLTDDPFVWDIAPLHRYPLAFAGILDICHQERSPVPSSCTPIGFIGWKLFQILSDEEWDCLTFHHGTTLTERGHRYMSFLLARTSTTVDAVIRHIRRQLEADDHDQGYQLDANQINQNFFVHKETSRRKPLVVRIFADMH